MTITNTCGSGATVGAALGAIGAAVGAALDSARGMRLARATADGASAGVADGTDGALASCARPRGAHEISRAAASATASLPFTPRSYGRWPAQVNRFAIDRYTTAR